MWTCHEMASCPGVFTVDATDADTGYRMSAIFSGPHARERAIHYTATLNNVPPDTVPIHQYPTIKVTNPITTIFPERQSN